MDFETITYEAADGVGHIRLNRPEGANAVNPTFSRELNEVLRHIQFDDDVRVVLVTAAGKVFCAGGDLKEFHAAGDQVAAMATAMLDDFHTAIYRMNRMAKPVVAGVAGAAGGAGMSLVTAFDLVVAEESAKFTMAYTRAGMTPDGTSTYFLARHVGLRRALDLTLTNRVLSAAEAESWGLVNRVVADGTVTEAAGELAAALAQGAPSLGRAKRVIYEGYESELEAAGQNEAVAIAAEMAAASGQEGIAAFVEKRSPVWR